MLPLPPDSRSKKNKPPHQPVPAAKAACSKRPVNPVRVADPHRRKLTITDEEQDLLLYAGQLIVKMQEEESTEEGLKQGQSVN